MYACQWELMSNDTTSAIEQIHQWRPTLAWRMLVDTPACTCYFFFQCRGRVTPLPPLPPHSISTSKPNNSTLRGKRMLSGPWGWAATTRSIVWRYSRCFPACTFMPPRCLHSYCTIHASPRMETRCEEREKKRNIKITLCGPGGSLS